MPLPTRRDGETGLDHAWFRQYEAIMGRFMSPDPYNGSYDPADPQSMNRYSYVLNNPLRFTDPSGLQSSAYGDCIWAPFGSATVTNSYTTQNGQKIYGTPTNAGPAGFAPVECFSHNLPGSGLLLPYPYEASEYNSQALPKLPVILAQNKTYNGTWYRLTLPNSNYCGPGGYGPTLNRVDAACKQHDACYDNVNASWLNNVFGTGGAAKHAAIQACNTQLCSSLKSTLYDWPTSQETGQATIVGAAFGCMP